MPLVDLVEGKVKDDSDKLNMLDDYLPAVEAALADYSSHRRKAMVVDLPGADSHDLDLPEAWLADFSTVMGVEFPLGNVPPNMVGQNDWTLYRSPTGLQLRLMQDKPKTGESVRLTFSIMRTEEDVPAGDIDAVACKAASICCDTLANIYTQTSDPTIAADTVDYQSKGDEFARRAKGLRSRYEEHLGIKGGTKPGLMTVAEAPPTTRARLTH